MSKRIDVGGVRVVFTTHALERYWDRVRPSLPSRFAVAREIERIAGCFVFSEAPPAWWNAGDEKAPEGWLLLGEDAAFPLRGLIAMTCLTRGTLPELTRELRNKRRKRRLIHSGSEARRRPREQPGRGSWRGEAWS